MTNHTTGTIPSTTTDHDTTTITTAPTTTVTQSSLSWTSSRHSPSYSDDCYEPEYEFEPVTFQLHTHPNEKRPTDSHTFTFHVLTVVPPPLEYMSMLHQHQIEISGRKVWTGSLFLAQIILDVFGSASYSTCSSPPTIIDANIFSQKRILELGAGTGIVGMTLFSAMMHISSMNRTTTTPSIPPTNIRHKPKCIVLTDGELETVQLLQQNITHVENTKYWILPEREEDESQAVFLQVTQLQWGENNTPPNPMQHHPSFSVWCQEQYPHVFHSQQVQFDILLAADVLYKPELPPLFFQTVATYMTQGGILFLCHIPRANVTHEKVIQTAQSFGFQVELVDTKKVISSLPDLCCWEEVNHACIYQITFASTQVE